MMDGISAMDTGNNGQMLQMNVDAIGEVKILTQGYQAEYGRSSGLQITAVTKSGSNRFQRLRVRHPDRLGLGREQLGQPEERRSEAEAQAARRWATRSAAPSASRAATTSCSSSTRTSIARRPLAINNGNPIRIRVPTALERAGDFSQTRDNTGALFNLIKDPTSTLPCTAANTAGCFQAGGVLGRIPSDRLYQTGLALLSRYPLPNVTQAAGTELQLRDCGAHD